MVDNKSSISSGNSSFEVKILSLSLVRPALEQPRKYFDEDKLRKLASSIKEKGLIHPIVVRKKGDYYEIVAGERRYIASQMAGLQEVPVIILDVDDKEAMEIALVENELREDLNPIEKAEAVQRMIKMYNMTQDEAGEILGVDRSTISNLLRLLKLPESIKRMLREGEITEGHARCLVNLPEEIAVRLAKLYADRSVRELERAVKRYKQNNNRKVKALNSYSCYEEEFKKLGLDAKISKKKSAVELRLKFKNDVQFKGFVKFLKNLLVGSGVVGSGDGDDKLFPIEHS